MATQHGAVTMRSVLAVLALVVGVAATASADTFLLRDGRRVQGELAEEFDGPDRKRWLRVTTAFGSLSFPEKHLRRRVKVDRAKQPLRCSQIVVTTMKGTVERSGDGGENWTAVSPQPREKETRATLPINTPNSVVAPGQQVRTGADGEVDLDVGWGVVHVASDSRVAFREDGDAAVSVLEGATAARLDRLPEDAEFRVETPQASMGVRGTTFTVRALGTTSRLAVERGLVVVGEASVEAGGAVSINADGAVVEDVPDAAEGRLFERLRTTIALPRTDRVRVPAGELSLDENGETVEISVPEFEMARTEVTVGQLRHFVELIAAHDDHRYCHPEEPDRHVHALREVDPAAYGPGAAAWAESFLTDDDLPATGMTWFTAYAYCAWIGAELPTQSQFLWAARGADDDLELSPELLLEQAWVRENAGDVRMPPRGAPWPADVGSVVRPHPVATRAPNRLGIHDLFGNVTEWLRDCERKKGEPIPLDGSHYEQPPAERKGTAAENGGVRTLGGGGFTDPVNRLGWKASGNLAKNVQIWYGVRPVYRVR